jgi:hypothetical protein
MTSSTETRRQNFIVCKKWVEQIVGEDANTITYDNPELFGKLVAAGYPTCEDQPWGVFVDLSVDLDNLTDVTVYTNRPGVEGNGEQKMGEAASAFLDWHKVNAGDDL